MTPENPENFVKISRPVSEIFGILLYEPMSRHHGFFYLNNGVTILQRILFHKTVLNGLFQKGWWCKSAPRQITCCERCYSITILV